MLWPRPPTAGEQSMPDPDAITHALPAPERAAQGMAHVTCAIAALVLAAPGDEPDEEAGDDPEEPGVTIAVDPETNSLIIVGSPRSIERVADLTRQLLNEIPAAPGRIRYIGLPEGVNARTTASTPSASPAWKVGTPLRTPRTSPDRTLPGPTSTKASIPLASIASMDSCQRTADATPRNEQRACQTQQNP